MTINAQTTLDAIQTSTQRAAGGTRAIATVQGVLDYSILLNAGETAAQGFQRTAEANRAKAATLMRQAEIYERAAQVAADPAQRTG